MKENNDSLGGILHKVWSCRCRNSNVNGAVIRRWDSKCVKRDCILFRFFRGTRYITESSVRNKTLHQSPVRARLSRRYLDGLEGQERPEELGENDEATDVYCVAVSEINNIEWLFRLTVVESNRRAFSRTEIASGK